jgi:hypothetical protein
MRSVNYDVLLNLSLEERANASNHANTHCVWLIFLRRLGVECGEEDERSSRREMMLMAMSKRKMLWVSTCSGRIVFVTSSQCAQSRYDGWESW